MGLMSIYGSMLLLGFSLATSQPPGETALAEQLDGIAVTLDSQRQPLSIMNTVSDFNRQPVVFLLANGSSFDLGEGGRMLFRGKDDRMTSRHLHYYGSLKGAHLFQESDGTTAGSWWTFYPNGEITVRALNQETPGCYVFAERAMILPRK